MTDAQTQFGRSFLPPDPKVSFAHASGRCFASARICPHIGMHQFAHGWHQDEVAGVQHYRRVIVHAEAALAFKHRTVERFARDGWQDAP